MVIPLCFSQYIWIEDYNDVPLFQDIVLELYVKREIMSIINRKVCSQTFLDIQRINFLRLSFPYLKYLHRLSNIEN
jgi:hypothetical protein